MELSETDKAFVRQQVQEVVAAINRLIKTIEESKPPRSIGPR